jgi:galactoside O-acetyltransferase
MSVGCRVFTSSDDYTEHGFGNATVPREFRHITSKPVIIGNFVTIGTNSVILPGVIIEDGVTVGANSVITRSLQEWGVYIGNKRIRDRNKKSVLNTYEKFMIMKAEEK